MNTNVEITKQLAAMAELGVQTAVGSTSTRISSAFVHVGDYHRLYGCFTFGDIAAGASGVCSLRQATDDSGTGAKLLGTASAAISTDNTGVEVEASVDQMDFKNGFYYVAVSVLPAVGSVPVSAKLLGALKHSP